MRSFSFFTRLFVYASLAVVSQYALCSVFHTHVCPPPLFDNCLYNVPNNSILYFGDSTTFTADESEPNQQNVAEIIAAIYPQLNVEPVFLAATTARVFCPILESRLNRGIVPQLVVIDAHLGSFSDAAYYQRNFKEEWRRNVIKFDSPLLRAWWRPAEVFKLSASMAPQDYARLSVFYQGKRVGTLGDALEERRSLDEKQRLLAYATLLDEPDKAKVLNFYIDMFELAREHHVPVLVYFTPMNYSLAARLIGSEARELMGAKRDYLVKRMRDEGAEVLDLMLDLDQSSFQTELLDHHLLYSGREYVARRVGETIVGMLGESVNIATGGDSRLHPQVSASPTSGGKTREEADPH